MAIDDQTLFVADQAGNLAVKELNGGNLKYLKLDVDAPTLLTHPSGLYAAGRWSGTVAFLPKGAEIPGYFKFPEGRIQGIAAEGNEIWVVFSEKSPTQTSTKGKDIVSLSPSALFRLDRSTLTVEKTGISFPGEVEQCLPFGENWLVKLKGQPNKLHLIPRKGGKISLLRTSGDIHLFTQIQGGQVYCATSSGIFSLDNKKVSLQLQKMLGPNPQELRTLGLINVQDTCWIATSEGVWKRSANLPDTLITNTQPVKCLQKGNDIWILEQGKGVYRPGPEPEWLLEF